MMRRLAAVKCAAEWVSCTCRCAGRCPDARAQSEEYAHVPTVLIMGTPEKGIPNSGKPPILRLLLGRYTGPLGMI